MDNAEYRRRFSNKNLIKLEDALGIAQIDAGSGDGQSTVPRKIIGKVLQAIEQLSTQSPGYPGERESQAQKAVLGEIQRRVRSGEGPSLLKESAKIRRTQSRSARARKTPGLLEDKPIYWHEEGWFSAKNFIKTKAPSKKRVSSRRNLRFSEARQAIVLLWTQHPNASHKEMVELADASKVPVPWADCSSWSDAYEKHTDAVKKLLSEAKHSKN